jgi:glycosyltransferase involved in cell wall biosynthesis
MNSLISVIVPVYKVEKYLPQCVDSILAQTYRNLEIILVDDGSPDSCPKICDEYAKKDGRVRVIHQKNAGVSAARNAGLDCAQGEYIGFVDWDDWIDAAMFQRLLALLKTYHTSIAICSFTQYIHSRNENKVLERSPKRQIPKGVVTSDEAIQKIILSVDPVFCGSLCNKLFSADLFNSPPLIRLDQRIHRA